MITVYRPKGPNGRPYLASIGDGAVEAEGITPTTAKAHLLNILDAVLRHVQLPIRTRQGFGYTILVRPTIGCGWEYTTIRPDGSLLHSEYASADGAIGAAMSRVAQEVWAPDGAFSAETIATWLPAESRDDFLSWVLWQRQYNYGKFLGHDDTRIRNLISGFGVTQGDREGFLASFEDWIAPC